MSGANQMVLGAVTFSPALSVEDAMAASIVHLLKELEDTKAERDFYKAAASKLMSHKPHTGRRKK